MLCAVHRSTGAPDSDAGARRGDQQKQVRLHAENTVSGPYTTGTPHNGVGGREQCHRWHKDVPSNCLEIQAEPYLKSPFLGTIIDEIPIYELAQYYGGSESMKQS